jgi:choline dehydrogenase-like flavoprotein
MNVVSGQSLCGPKALFEESVDVVVVGSGAAGAVVAAELAEAGQRVVVLEEGPNLLPDELATMRPSEAMRRGWREAGMSFALPVGDTPAINLMVGRCVGGSSVMTGGVCFRTPPHVLSEWVKELGLSELSPEAMVPFFEEVERRCHIEEVPEHMRSRSTQLYAEGAEKLGYSLVKNHRNTKDCDGCSRCNFGCPHKAKWSVDLTYLPRAVAAGATVFCDARVGQILFHGDRACGVSGHFLSPLDRKSRRFVIHARRVVLACGGMHTPGVLQDSGVADRLPAVGEGMTLHPSMRVMARFDQPVQGWRGALQSAHSDAFVAERITLMSVFVPTGVLAATLPGMGPSHKRRAEQAPHMALFGGLIHDDPGGRVLPRRSLLGSLWGRQEPVVTYRMSERDRKAVSRMLRILADTYFAAGAKEVFLPILGGPPGFPEGGITADELRGIDLDKIPSRQLECASQHPLGSCRMGLSADDAVVDQNGQVFGVRELFVVDSSILPTSLGVNPQVTVMAVATRLAYKLRERALPAA